jgi:L-fuculose-phosphate aldolase
MPIHFKTNDLEPRQRLIAAAQEMARRGLAQGTSGNLSLRTQSGILITPSAIPYHELRPDMIPLLHPDSRFTGAYRPSSEWRFHLDIMLARPEAGGVVHHHAPYTTALAITRQEIPACHYMIARFGGAPIRCAGYALFGTAELSRLVMQALQGRTACLMANHGGIAIGPSIEAALGAATELETLAQQYVLARSAGVPVLLTAEEIQQAVAQFATAYRENIPQNQ